MYRESIIDGPVIWISELSQCFLVVYVVLNSIRLDDGCIYHMRLINVTLDK